MTKPAVHILKDLKLDEISLCEFPASPGAHVSIFKSQKNPLKGDVFERVAKALSSVVPEEGMAAFNAAVSKAGEATAQMFGAALASDEAQRKSYEVMQNVNQGVYALGDSIRSIYSDPTVTDKPAAVEQTTDEFLEWIKTAVSPEDIDAGMSSDDDGNNSADDIGPDGVSKAMANKTKTDADPDGTGTVSVPSKIGKADAGKTHPDGGIVGEDGKVQKSIVLGDGETVIKKSDLTSLIAEGIQKALKDPEGETEKLRQTVAKMNDERETAELVQKAGKLVDGVPHVTVDQAVSVMKALKGNAEALTAYEATLNSARIAKSLQPIGVDGQTGSVGSPSDRLETMTDAYVTEQEKVGKSISRQAAQAAVLEKHPQLYSEIKAARGAR